MKLAWPVSFVHPFRSKRSKFLLGVGGVDMLTSSTDTVAVLVKAAQRKNRIFVVTTEVAKCQSVERSQRAHTHALYSALSYSAGFCGAQRAWAARVEQLPPASEGRARRGPLRRGAKFAQLKSAGSPRREERQIDSGRAATSGLARPAARCLRWPCW